MSEKTIYVTTGDLATIDMLAELVGLEPADAEEVCVEVEVKFFLDENHFEIESAVVKGFSYFIDVWHVVPDNKAEEAFKIMSWFLKDDYEMGRLLFETVEQEYDGWDFGWGY